jgi:hypothetical protein
LGKILALEVPLVVHDPDVCYCFECSMRNWETSCFKEEELPAQKPLTIEVEKVRNNGELPPFLGVLQRHFEKAKPVTGPAPKQATHLTAPLEMLDFLVPAILIGSLESVEIVYQKL